MHRALTPYLTVRRAPVRSGMAMLVLVIDADFVMENGMEAHIFEACDLLYLVEIAAVILSQSYDGVLGTKHLLMTGDGEKPDGGLATHRLEPWSRVVIAISFDVGRAPHHSKGRTS